MLAGVFLKGSSILSSDANQNKLQPRIAYSIQQNTRSGLEKTASYIWECLHCSSVDNISNMVSSQWVMSTAELMDAK